MKQLFEIAQNSSDRNPSDSSPGDKQSLLISVAPVCRSDFLKNRLNSNQSDNFTLYLFESGTGTVSIGSELIDLETHSVLVIRPRQSIEFHHSSLSSIKLQRDGAPDGNQFDATDKDGNPLE